MRLRLPLRPYNCIWKKPNLFTDYLLYSDSSQHAIFSQSMINAGFFTSGIDPDILMNELKDCVIFLIWQPGFCLIFILSKKRFLIWRLTGNASFMSFLVGIWSRNSEIDKFKISKGLYLQK